MFFRDEVLLKNFWFDVLEVLCLLLCLLNIRFCNFLAVKSYAKNRSVNHFCPLSANASAEIGADARLI
ncbi:MAG: hypothetical protein IKZ11_04175, partial [Alistipes sp.]|nr:hypothetical protein [Alistipes sp.]